MAACESIHLVPSDLEFAVFSADEIKRMSLVRIITGLTFDELGEALPGGLYDPLMGPAGLKSYVSCLVCGQAASCPGHIGHVELATLVYNPFFKKLAQRILSIACLHCCKVQIKDYMCKMIELQLRLIDAGFLVESHEVEMYKIEAAIHGDDETLIKLEDGGVLHPRIAALKQLVEDASNDCNATKSTCGERTSLVNLAMQRPSSKKCIHCKKNLSNVRYLYQKIICYLTAAELREKHPNMVTTTTGCYKVILADECRDLLRQIYDNTPELLELLFPIFKKSKEGHSKTSPVDLFFMEAVIVTPPKARPVGLVAGKLQEHPSTNFYRNIIENDSVLRVILKRAKGLVNQETPEAKNIYEKAKGETQYEKLYNAWQELQTSVDVLLDANMSRENIGRQGLKQVLEKKEGLLRKHMMGKRVNYAARTVITPDPYIGVEEVGIPDIFARKLSYPTPVTPWNVSQLRKMIMNGPDVHPGANMIEMENSHKIAIPRNDPVQREALAKRLLTYGEQGVKIVHRHVVNGDVVLLNRQPSLHKPSIMAHKLRVLSNEKTFRLHYSNCKSYNADFDGDEMNLHLPQGEVARSEAYSLVNVANNYLSPKDGTPLGGLIQDHVISGVKLSIRGRFFNREDYHQMVYQGLANNIGNIKLLPPAIVKPFRLWSGKQVLSTIIMNIIPGDGEKINLNSSAHIPSKQWQTIPTRTDPSEYLSLCEHTVTILNGELLVGVLDKKQYGATTFGLIHCVYELYGGQVSTCLLTAFTKLFTYFLQREGFSLGVKDILVTKEADAKRRKFVKKSRKIGPEIVANALDVNDENLLEEKMKEAYSKDPKFRVLLDRKYKAALDEYTNNINKTCVPTGLISPFPSNNLQLMILSGAKGSLVNAMQISSLLGQIELEGKRPPLMISGKSLPSFAASETSPKSGGFIDGRFMTGIQPQDFFFHCMAGREGLIDTAVKTSRSGYLQRCLIKHLEGLQVNYDLTVRDSDNTVVQFLYGEDGLDIGKAKFLHSDVGRQVLLLNEHAILRTMEAAAIKDDEFLSKIQKHNKQITKWQKTNNSNGDQGRKFQSAFTNFCAELRDEADVKNPNKISKKTGRRRLDNGLIKLWQKAGKDSKALELKDSYILKHKRCPDPVISLYKPDCFFGAVSEAVEQIISHCRNTESKAKLREIMCVKAMKALAPPGEPVGLLAAQSIGEPSTQMTLNTFHFAGRGEMNVTLGIPRLREILMMASVNIKTPSMDVPILPAKNRGAEKLRIKMNRVTLSNVLEKIDVSIKSVLKPERANQYKLRFKFLPREAYQDDYCVKPKQILKYVNNVFFKQLFRALIKQSSKGNIVDILEKQDKPNQNGDGEDEELTKESNRNKADSNGNGSLDEESDNDDDDDATNIKLKSRKQDETEYDDPDENDEIEDADKADNDDDDVQLIENANSPVNVNEDEDEEDEDKANGSDKLSQDVFKNSMVHEYVYDKESYLWCKITFNLGVRYKTPDISSILKELAEKSIIHEVQHIKRAIICKGANDAQILKTDGINIVEMFKYNDVLDLNRLYSNDIHAIARTYGIEAAVSVLIKEVTNVFKVYGINIDRRHLCLIADYMTFDGTYQPLSRRGMEHSASPLQQMTFESSLQFLRNATISGRNDELNSPSSRLVVGLPIRNGTGAFDLLTKYKV